MNVYTSKYPRLPGSSYAEALSHARQEYNVIAHSTKRQPYIKSKYFNGDKVFLKVFWDHVMQKRLKERTRRLRFYRAALDVLRHSQITPETTFNADERNISLHRFYGVTKDGIYFCVQVKEDKRTGRKDFMSVFDRKAH